MFGWLKGNAAPNTDQIFKFFESAANMPENGHAEPDEIAMQQLTENEALHASILSLLPLLYAFKNPTFQEEREWRGGNIVVMTAAPEVKHLDVEKRRKEEIGWLLHNMDYRALTDRIVPYRSFTLNTKTPAIREVLLGPRNITPILIVRIEKAIRVQSSKKDCP